MIFFKKIITLFKTFYHFLQFNVVVIKQKKREIVKNKHFFTKKQFFQKNEN